MCAESIAYGAVNNSCRKVKAPFVLVRRVRAKHGLFDISIRGLGTHQLDRVGNFIL